jgi:hypothetical protein
MPPTTETGGGTLRRLAWFFGIAIASALATAAVAYGLRAVLHAA